MAATWQVVSLEAGAVTLAVLVLLVLARLTGARP